jgi:hypothetical protein
MKHSILNQVTLAAKEEAEEEAVEIEEVEEEEVVDVD